MKYIKKCFLIFAVFLAMSVSVSAEDVDEYSALCEGLGLLPEENYYTDDFVTREEFSYIATKLGRINPDDTYKKGDIYFYDVTEDNRYVKNINSLASKDLIRGFSDGRFEPLYKVTKTDVSYTIINILGYKNQAEALGGYPLGYVYAANELGLFDNVSASEFITKRQMCRIIFNALNTSGLSMQIENGVPVYKKEKENTLLKNAFEVVKIEGIVNANAITSLKGDKELSDGYIRINDRVYSAQPYAQELIGYNVRAYVKNEKATDSDTIVSITPYRCKSVLIEDENIDDGTSQDKVVTYEDKKYKNYYLSREIDYIYNGKLETNLKKEDIFTKSGHIEIIDNDNDNRYDVMKITSYESAIVNTVSQINENILDEYSDKIDLKNKKYRIFMNKKEIFLDDIQKGDSITYQRTKDDDNYIIYVTRGEEFFATVTGTREGKYITLDGGTEYEISKSYLDKINGHKAQVIRAGLEATFYFDIKNRVTGYTMEKDDNASVIKYGYLITIKGDYEDEGIFAKLLKTDGIIEKIKVAENVTCDGIRYKSNSVFVRNISKDGFVRSVIKYKLNDNDELSYIDTPTMTKEENPDTSLTADFIAEIDETWSNASSGILDGRFYFDNDTIVFQVPGDDLKNDDSLYSVTSKSVFTNGGTYNNTKGYDLSKEYVAKVVSMESGSGGIGRSSPMAMVDNISQIFDETEEEILPVVETEDGTVLTLSSNRVIEKAGNLKRGDIIQYEFDEKKRINEIDILCNSSDKKLGTFSKGSEGSSSYYTYRGELRFGTYILIEKHGNSFIAAELPESEKGTHTIVRDNVTYRVKKDPDRDDRTSVFVYNYSGTVYEYDRKTDKIKKTDMSCLNDCLYRDNPDARLFIKQGYGYVGKLYVIR